MSPRSVTSRAITARTKAPAASSLAHSGARERSTSSASRVETIRVNAGRGWLAARPVAELAHHGVRDAQLRRGHVLAPRTGAFPPRPARRRRRRARRSSGRSAPRWRRAPWPRRARPRAGRRPTRSPPRGPRASPHLPPLQGLYGSPASSSPRNRSGALRAISAELARWAEFAPIAGKFGPPRAGGRSVEPRKDPRDVVPEVDDQDAERDARAAAARRARTATGAPRWPSPRSARRSRSRASG